MSQVFLPDHPDRTLTRTGNAHVLGIDVEWIGEKSMDAPQLIPVGGLYEYVIGNYRGVLDGVIRGHE